MKEYVIITWPFIQDLMDEPNFDEDAFLINDEKGLAKFGSSAYFVPEDIVEQWSKKQFLNGKRQITLARFKRLIKEAEAVIVDQDFVVYPDIDPIEDDYFLKIRLVDDESSHEVDYLFREEDNQVIDVTKDEDAVLITEDGEQIFITLLTKKKLIGMIGIQR